MFQAAMSNSSLSEEASNNLSSFNPLLLQNTTTNIINSTTQQPLLPKKVKKKRSLPGNPDPDAEVIALSPKTLLATNRFICEICNKGFQRDQNLQLHRRGHNLPWKLKQRSKTDIVRKKAYVCPESSCVHHHPSRALGDLTGIKKHFCRKHGEKKYKCEKCSKIYAVQSDWKAHSKTCGTREYRCDCGTLFSRKDSFITHRAFCDALAEESARLSTNPFSNPMQPPQQPPQFSTLSTSQNPNNSSLFPFSTSPWDPPPSQNPNPNPLIHIKTENNTHFSSPPPFFQPPHIFTNNNHSNSKGLLTSLPFTSSDNAAAAAMSTSPFFSATALLQKATTLGPVSAMLNGFDELGALSRHEMAAVFTPQPSSSTNTNTNTNTTTTTTTTTSNSDHHDHYSAMLATWRKNNDGLTRDFLGLTAGDYNHNGHHVHVDDDEVVGNMLKFTGGLQYGMTAPYDRDNSSSSSSMLMKPHQQHPLVHHHHHQQQIDGFGFVGAEHSTTAAAASGSRWG
ncbi:protein indeterminate-domain 12 [Beta vulgaris subsp. vulgaris]|uniref:protein indeterminate-domain 12 n=1 Tax=Beta vulgaris subsp. vulgaris TaxID=3555 RepID=UPI00203683EA|nr:protein indeterminate-domain 12 [Beta vulgaris subsp. vulgaris]